MKWYYSKAIEMYVSLEPLRVSSRVLEVADEYGFLLSWDDCGFLNNIDYEEARLIAGGLNGHILTPGEYWQVYKEACDEGCREVTDSLASDEFSEFLDRVYVSESEYIDNPIIGKCFEYKGDIVNFEHMQARPCYAKINDFDANGHPKSLKPDLSESGLIKFWSPDLSVTATGKTVAVRGYSASASTMSYDLGIPADARAPKLMVRLCCKNIPTGYVSDEEAKNIERILKSGGYADLEGFKRSELFERAIAPGDSAALAIEEAMFNNLGKIKVERGISGDKRLEFEDFCDYVEKCHDNLRKAIDKKLRILFVTGHKNPDADTVVSSVFEAYRLSLSLKRSDMAILPYIQADILPSEIAEIFDSEIYSNFIFETDVDMPKLLESGRVRLAYVDQNYQKEFQKYVIAITDHHKLANENLPWRDQIPCHIELVGSTAGLIARKYIGQGYEFDAPLSKILYCAMLMDTENREPLKMTAFDKTIMDRFKAKASVDFDHVLYSQLMTEMLSETDIGTLYFRDYREYDGFGFSIIKVSDFINKECFPRKLGKFKAIAEDANRANNLFLTFIMIVEYEKGGLNVSRERLYYVFNQTADSNMRERVTELVSSMAKLYYAPNQVTVNSEYMEISCAGKTLSRKILAPAVEKLLGCMTRYSFVKAVGKYVSTNLLSENDAVLRSGIDYSTDDKGVITDISFSNAKKLVKRLGLDMPDARDYWKIYSEAVSTGNTTLLKSITDSEYSEFIDTCSIDGKIVYRPEVTGEGLTGDFEDIEITEGRPGLIEPKEISYKTGLPVFAHAHAEYGNKNLWRYWSPDENGTYVFTRSHNFLMDRTSIEVRMSPEYACRNLGVRVMKESRPEEEVKINVNEGSLEILYKSEFDDDFKSVYNHNLTQSFD